MDKLSYSITLSPINTLVSLLEKKEVQRVLEWTFAYDLQSRKQGLPYNTTFFEKVGGVSYSEWKDGKVEPQALCQKIEDEMTDWQDICRDSLLIFSNEENEKSLIQKRGIEEMIDIIEMAKISLLIELEKASPHPLMTDGERSAREQSQEQIQMRVYGERLSENLDEIQATLALMREEYHKDTHNEHYLSDAERSEYAEIYTKLIQAISLKYPDTVFESDITNNPYNSLVDPQYVQDARSIQIPRKVYYDLWKMLIDANGLRQKVSTVKGTTSIYDGVKVLEIPAAKEYDEKDFMTVLLLMVHEISAHYVNQEISEDNGFIVRGAGNVEKEEGLAILMENVFEGKTLEESNRAGYSFPFTLAGEMISKVDRQRLVDLRIKISQQGKVNGDKYHSRDLRVKRGYSMDSAYSQRKDMSYGRGIRKIIAMLESKEYSLTDFFVGKVGIDDIASGKMNELIPRESQGFPLLFPEMLLYMFIHGRDEFTHDKFMDYMKQKYSHILREGELDSLVDRSKFSQLKIFIKMWKIVERYRKSLAAISLPNESE